MTYHPNREPTVKLECDCLSTMWGAIKRDGKWWALCDNHDERAQEIIRVATAMDLLANMARKEIVVQERLF